MVSLTELILSNNMLSDTIPAALGSLTNLDLLYLNDNEPHRGDTDGTG